jgi:hypothetical protein
MACSILPAFTNSWIERARDEIFFNSMYPFIHV